MDRREFLRTTGAAAAASAAAAGVAAPALASGVEELRLAMAWPDAVAGPADQARRLANRIEAMSGGRYRITLVPGHADGFAAVQAGAADLYHGTENDHLTAHRALAYFAGLPGERGIAPRHLVAWLLVGGGQDLWDGLAGEFGIKSMLAGHAGDGPCFVAGRRVTHMRELAGQKVSVVGLAREVAKGFGLEPVAVEASSLGARMARGEILAAEQGGVIASHALGLLPDAAPYAVGASINRHGYALSLGMRRALWDRLSATDQAIFSAAAAAETQLALAEEEAHRRLLYPEPGPERTWPLAPDLGRAIARVADAVVAHVAASDAHAMRVNAGYVAFRRLALGEDPAESGTA